MDAVEKTLKKNGGIMAKGGPYIMELCFELMSMVVMQKAHSSAGGTRGGDNYCFRRSSCWLYG